MMSSHVMGSQSIRGIAIRRISVKVTTPLIVDTGS